MNAHRIPASDSPDSLPVAQAYNPFSPAQTADRSPHRARDVESRPANLRRQPGKPLVYVPNLLLRGLQSLPVEWNVA